MDAIRNAISKMHYKIPAQILNTVFVGQNYSQWGISGLSVDKQIEDLVIRPRVCMDCNLVGGQQILVDLTGLEQVSPIMGTVIVRVPKSRTQGRAILSPLNVMFINPTQLGNWYGASTWAGVGNLQQMDGGIMSVLESSILRSVDKIPHLSTSSVSLIAENTIRITELITPSPQMVMRCVIENDANLNNISPKSYHAFEKLVEYAVKSYIYNTMIVKMDQAQLQSGWELGVIKSTIEGYSDAEQNYQDFLDGPWKQIAFMNDRTGYDRFILLNSGLRP